MTAAHATLSDEQLVVRAREGDVRAFETLVDRHMGMVHAIACARLGDRDAAEDLVQEVFLRAFLSLQQLSRPAALAGWLGQITRNLAMSWLRRDGRHARLAPQVPLEEQHEAVADTRIVGAGTLMERTEREGAVWAALMQLEPGERELVLLHYSEGLTTKDIGLREGVHHTTIVRRLQRAVRNLRHEMEPMVRELAPSLRASSRVKTRTLSLLAAFAAMSAASRAALAAHALEEAAVLAQVPAAAVSASSGIAKIIAAGAKGLTTGKGLAAAAAVAAALGGVVLISHTTGDERSAPPAGPTPAGSLPRAAAVFAPMTAAVEAAPLSQEAAASPASPQGGWYAVPAGGGMVAVSRSSPPLDAASPEQRRTPGARPAAVP